MKKILLVSACIFVLALTSASRTSIRTRSTRPFPMPQAAESESHDDIRRQQKWFLFQRMYPFGKIKPNARRTAWEALVKQKALSPQSAAPAWSAIGPQATTTDFSADPVESGRINTIAICPTNPQIILVGGATGGVWRSVDGGTTFAPVTDNQVDLAVGSIEFSQSNSSIAYAGMGDPYGGYLGTGVLKSTDQGATWSRVDNGSLPEPATVTKIQIDPTDPNRVYLCMLDSLQNGEFSTGGFYLSTDGGVNWSQTLMGTPTDLVISPANPMVLYLGASDLISPSGLSGPGGLYTSADGGSTWSLAFQAPFQDGFAEAAYVATSADGNTIYVYSGGDVRTGFELRVAVSADAGTTWHEQSTTGLDPNQFGYDSYIAVDPSNTDNVYVGSRDLYKSTNGGRSWTNLTMGYTPSIGESYEFTPGAGITHVDQHALAFVPGNSNSFYIGNDGGLSFTTNGGHSFISLNSSLDLTQFYAIVLDQLNPGLSYGGAQDNGVQRLVQGATWNQILTGDGGHMVVDPVDPSNVFAADEYGGIFRLSGFGTESSTEVASNGTFGETNSDPRIDFIAPLVSDGVDQTLYFGTWRLFTSTNLGETWTSPGGNIDLTFGAGDFDVLSAIAVSRTDPKVIYTGSAEGRVMATSSGGSQWQDVTGMLPTRSITAIAVDPQNPATAYIAFSGYESGHVFMTTDLGADWTDMSGNLPDLPVNALLIDPRNSGALYIGNDIGVFQLAGGGNAWQPFNTGLPPVVVTSLVSQTTGLIQAGTYGRGAYQISAPLFGPGFQVVAATAPAAQPAGQSVQIPISVIGAGGFSGDVALTATPVTGGTSAGSVTPANNLKTSIAPSSVGIGGSATLTVTSSNATLPGTYLVAVTGTSGGVIATTDVALVISGPDFTLGFNPPSITGSAGTTIDVTAVVNPVMGFSDQVDVSPSGPLPAGLKVKPGQVLSRNGDAAFKIKIANSILAGQYSIVFTGTDKGNGLTHSTTLQLTVQ